MSNAVFPALPGLKWNIKRMPMWKTIHQESASGKTLTASLMSYPLRKYSLSYEFLRDNATAELQNLEAFFNSRRGAFDTFLYNDPDDRAVTAQAFGSGDGVTTSFQLVRARGGFIEPVQSINFSAGSGVSADALITADSTVTADSNWSSGPVVMVNGVTKTSGTDYTISALGVVTFTVAPAAAASLTWTGNYYWRCRFVQDMIELDKFLLGLWQLQKLEFVIVKQ